MLPVFFFFFSQRRKSTAATEVGAENGIADPFVEHAGCVRNEGNDDGDQAGILELSEEDAFGELRNHVGVQTDLGTKGYFDIMLLTDTEKDLSVLTSIPSIAVLDVLEQHVQVSLPNNKDVRKRIVLTMMRLKLGLSLTCLAVLFRSDRSHCSRLFSSTIIALANILQEMIDWPSKDEIRNWMPKSFMKFLKTRIILDC